MVERVHAAHVGLEQRVQTARVLLEDPQRHGAQERVRVRLRQVLVLPLGVAAQHFLSSTSTSDERQ